VQAAGSVVAGTSLKITNVTEWQTEKSKISKFFSIAIRVNIIIEQNYIIIEESMTRDD